MIGEDARLCERGVEWREQKNRDQRSRADWTRDRKDLGIELVFECTGKLTRRDDPEKHVRAGARFVLLSAPSKDEDVAPWSIVEEAATMTFVSSRSR